MAKQSPEKWQSRIVGYADVDPNELLANPANWRVHPKAQQEALSGVLSEVGWVQSVVVNKTTGHVVDGHLRVSLALSRDEATIPVVLVELTEAEEKLVLATIDPIAAMAVADKEQLDELLRGVNSDSAAVQELIAGIAEANGLDYGAPPGGDPGAAMDRAAELQAKWGTARGQIWQVGRHRVMCGDSTSAEDVVALMGGMRADAVVTDPPYGINREGIINDDPAGLRALFDGVLVVAPVEHAVVIAFQSPRLFPAWIDAILGAGHKFERALWFYDQTDVTFPWRGWLMTSQIALVSTFGKPVWAEGVYHHDCYIVETAGKQADTGGHTTAKPLDVVRELMQHTTGTVYDPFLGSGTTAVAAEQLGRICYGMEIEPKYVAVTLERLAGMGLVPELVKNV